MILIGRYGRWSKTVVNGCSDVQISAYRTIRRVSIDSVAENARVGMNSDSLTKATRVAIFIGDTRTTVKIPNPKYQLHRPPR